MPAKQNTTNKPPGRLKTYMLMGLVVLFIVIGYFRFFSEARSAPPPETKPTVLDTALNIPDIKEKLAKAKPQPSANDFPPLFEETMRDLFAPPSILFNPQSEGSIEASEGAASPQTRQKKGEKSESAPEETLEEKPEPPPPPSVVLNGTIVGLGPAIAVIDKKFYHIGDSVADYQVAGIDKNSVLLTAENAEVRLTVTGTTY